MSLMEDLSALGVDTNEALARFMGNSDLYERLLKKFPKAVEESPVLTYARSEDYETATSNAHALKGVTGNLSLTPLYESYTKIVDMYRESNFEQANALLDETLKLQQKFLDVIEKYM